MAHFYSKDIIDHLIGLRLLWQNWIRNNPTLNPQSWWTMQPFYEQGNYITWIEDGAPTTSGTWPKSSAGSPVGSPPSTPAGEGSGVPPIDPYASSNYKHINTSFAGTDIVATITPLGGKPMVFAEIQTISYSIYRPIMPVTALGRINPKGVVRGPRTIAGSLIFTVFDRHALKSVMNHYSDNPIEFGSSFGFNSNDIQDLRMYAKTDEMPPFDISISFLNEYGNSSTMTLYGVYILTEGQTMSIEDMITENTMQFIAMDIDLMDYGTSMTSWNSKNSY